LQYISSLKQKHW